MAASKPGDAVLDEINRTLASDYAVHHSTLQVELGTTQHACSLHDAQAPAAAHAAHGH